MQRQDPRRTIQVCSIQHWVCGALLGLAPPAMAVDEGRLRDASSTSSDWVTYGHNYENQRFSTLDQVHRGKVGQLEPRWTYHTGIKASFQASPIVADGMMYLSTPKNHVVALDAATGVEKWRYAHEYRPGKLCCGPANRGVSVGYGAVYMATADARLIALDAQTGSVLWDVPMAVADTKPTEVGGGSRCG
ncbi:MAG: PQQ-binding-like beta-propeller repeat protein [Myxococcota bacterium]